MRSLSLALLASLAVALPAVGQSKGTFEIGVFGRYTKFPSAYDSLVLTKDNVGTAFPGDAPADTRITNHLGGGARIGLFVAKNLAIEVDASTLEFDFKPFSPGVPNSNSYQFTAQEFLNPIHLQLVYNAPLGDKFSWMIGGGGNYTILNKTLDKNAAGFGGMTGIRWRPSRHWSIRAEVTGDIVPSGFGVPDSKSNTYLGANLGLSLLLGGKGCDHSKDMIGIHPSSATLQPGQSQTFTADATWCGNPDQVVYRLSGPGTLDSLNGRYTATTVGSATVTAYSRHGKLTSAAAITIAQPAPTPPPAPRPAPPPPPPPVQTPPPPPPARTPVRPAPTFELQMVHFRFDHSDLTKGGVDTVKSVATLLKAHPEVNVDVVGHTDSVGTNAYNMKLSQARAEVVKNLLVKLGISADRISVKWRGFEEPLEPNATAAGRAMNRRTEIKQNN